MTIKGFHKAAPIVKEITHQEALLFRIEFGDLFMEIKAYETKTLPAIDEMVSRYAKEDEKKVMAELKRCIESKIKNLNEELKAIK